MDKKAGLTAVDFIRAITAVMLVVTAEPLWDARAGRWLTGKLCGQTGARRTRLLVTSVSTIIVGVADPRLRRAPTIGTAELVGGTRVVHCNDNRPTNSYNSHPTECFRKKVAPRPPKRFGIFSLRLSLFAWNFANLLAIHIHIYRPIFVDLSLYFIKFFHEYPSFSPCQILSRPIHP